ncbi:MAG: DUF6152 family protein [Maricaulaceae bacterium]|jgi:hypothetical protein
MFNKNSVSLALGALVFCAGSGAAAQQGESVSALYDTDNPVTVVGEIVEVEWSAPRSRLHVHDEETDRRWIIVGGSPYDLSAEQRASVRAGESVRVIAFQSRDRVCAPACNAFGDEFAKSDGSPLVTPPLPPRH